MGEMIEKLWKEHRRVYKTDISYYEFTQIYHGIIRNHTAGHDIAKALTLGLLYAKDMGNLLCTIGKLPPKEIVEDIKQIKAAIEAMGTTENNAADAKPSGSAICEGAGAVALAGEAAKAEGDGS